MIAALAILKSGGAIVGGFLGWLFADWHRLLIALGLIAIASAYVVGDMRGRHAGDGAWQAKVDGQAKAVIASADRAQTAEHNRQLAAATAAQTDLDTQMRARDAADAARAAQTDKEIAAYEQKLAATGRSCGLTDDDLGALGVRPATQPGAATRRR